MTFAFTAFALVQNVSPLKIMKIFSNKREFVLQKTTQLNNNARLVIRDSSTGQTWQGKIKICKPKTCLAELDDNISKLDPALLQSYAVTINHKPHLPYIAYLGYGSPLGSAFRLGLRTKDSSNFTYGGVVGRIQGSTQIIGTSLSLLGIYKLSATADWHFNLNAELGYAFAQLNYVNNASTISVKENAYIAAILFETIYQFKNYGIGVGAGLSKNGFSPTYATSNGTFNNPYGLLLSFVEFGFHYHF